MSIILSGETLVPGTGRLDVKFGDFGLTLIMREVSDDERLADTALFNKYWNETDPVLAVRWYGALDDLRKSAIQDWEGVNDPSGKPVKFTPQALAILLKVPGARKAVTGAVRDYFDASGVDPKALGESAKPPTNTLPGGTDKPQPTESSSTSGGSEPGNSPSP